MNDEQIIIERVLAGETRAFRDLVELYQSLILQFARNMLRNREDAEDLTQEVLVAAYRNLTTYDAKRARFSTWLLTIARNCCLNQLKRRHAETLGDVEPMDRGLPPPDAAAQCEVWQSLTVALETLPLEQRTAFVLAEIQELPHAEIALIEGIELGTVKSRVSRARERLRLALREWKPTGRFP